MKELLSLFFTFARIGAFAFGGGYAMIPMIQEQVVGNGWITEKALTDFIAISEATPGPFAINISTFVGNSVGGVFGAICATVGVILPSLIIIIIVAMIMKKFINNKFVKGALAGVKPIVLALILSTALLLLVKVIFFNGNAIKGDLQFDIKSFTLLIVLGGFMIIYHKVKKKSLGAIKLLGLAALFGLIIFSI